MIDNLNEQWKHLAKLNNPEEAVSETERNILLKAHEEGKNIGRAVIKQDSKIESSIEIEVVDESKNLRSMSLVDLVEENRRNGQDMRGSVLSSLVYVKDHLAAKWSNPEKREETRFKMVELVGLVNGMMDSALSYPGDLPSVIGLVRGLQEQISPINLGLGADMITRADVSWASPEQARLIAQLSPERLGVDRQLLKDKVAKGLELTHVERIANQGIAASETVKQMDEVDGIGKKSVADQERENKIEENKRLLESILGTTFFESERWMWMGDCYNLPTSLKFIDQVDQDLREAIFDNKGNTFGNNVTLLRALDRLVNNQDISGQYLAQLINKGLVRSDCDRVELKSSIRKDATMVALSIFERAITCNANEEKAVGGIEEITPLLMKILGGVEGRNITEVTAGVYDKDPFLNVIGKELKKFFENPLYIRERPNYERAKDHFDALIKIRKTKLQNVLGKSGSNKNPAF